MRVRYGISIVFLNVFVLSILGYGRYYFSHCLKHTHTHTHTHKKQTKELMDILMGVQRIPKHTRTEPQNQRNTWKYSCM